MELPLRPTEVQSADDVSGMLLHPSKVNPAPDFRRAFFTEYAAAHALRGLDPVPYFVAPPLPPMTPSFVPPGEPPCPTPYSL